MGLQTFFEDTLGWIDHQKWLEPIADRIQEIVQDIYSSTGSAGKQVQNFFNGTWLGHPVHPVITDLPIGSWTAGVTLDILENTTGNAGFGRGADIAISLGLVSSVGAVLSGASDWQHTTGEAKRIGVTHALLNIVSASLFVSSLLARGEKKRNLGKMLALAGYSIAAVSAYLGGDMVFRQKIGVNHAPLGRFAPQFTPVIQESELPENRLTRVYLDGTPILLVRKGQQIFAIAETCAHLGGPLAEGELRPDDSVVCPWHGSRFDLKTGEVLDGPSAYSEPCFETRIQDQKIMVRRARETRLPAGEPSVS